VTPPRNIRPVYISHTPGVQDKYIAAAIEAVRRVSAIAGVELPVEYFGAFNVGDRPYGSVEWYIQRAWNPQRTQLNASQMLNLSRSEPWQEKEPHYELWITHLDLWSGDGGNNFVYGLTQRGLGTIQSYARMEARFRGQEIPTEHMFGEYSGA